MTEKTRHIIREKRNSDFKSLFGKIRSAELSRRSFLKFSTLSVVSISAMAACKRKTGLRTLAYFADPQKVNPGKISWFTSVCNQCNANCPILVKTFEGRPIKIEGNPEAFTGGGVCAAGHASLVQLYHQDRITRASKKREAIAWKDLDEEIIHKFEELDAQKKEIVLITPSINGAATIALIKDFKSKYPHFKHLIYEPINANAILSANEKCFGKAVIPDYQFDKAKVVVSFNADFMASWLNPVENTFRFTQKRDFDNKREMSVHIQYESYPSLSGMNADMRIPLKASDEGILLTALYNYIAAKTSKAVLMQPKQLSGNYHIRETGDLLLKNIGRSILISSNTEHHIQVLINGINHLLGNIGRSIDLDHPNYYFKQKASDLSELIKSHKSGKLGAILSLNNDFLKIHPKRRQLKSIIEEVPLKISMNMVATEFCKMSDYLCPIPHFTECWNDHEPKYGIHAIAQAIIKPIYPVRSYQDSLLRWSRNKENWGTYLKQHWKEHIFEHEGFDEQWEDVLKKGFLIKSDTRSIRHEIKIELQKSVNQLAGKVKELSPEILFYRHPTLDINNPGINPWLAELPDPVTQGSWGIVALISPAYADELHLKDGQFIKISNKTIAIEIPVLIHKGVHEDCMAIPLGKMISYITDKINPFDIQYLISKNREHVKVEKSRKRKKAIIRQENYKIPHNTPLEIYLTDYTAFTKKQGDNPPLSPFVARNRNFAGHHWAMLIDLNKCTGCESCVISCQFENNIPLVGTKESAKKRQMHWMRIDQYHSSIDGKATYHFLPVNCQQCDNAPCESVCPVAAVSSSSEGLSQQNYQRCIGVRYCAVNCPYTVRRFNYDHYMESNANYLKQHLHPMILNPDVSVREKGLIEKCSFCTHRIMDAKAKAKRKNTALIDGDIQTACQQSCPAKAIYFGDLNDRSSEVYGLSRSKRAFQLLPELGTAPSVYYLSKLRNKDF